MDSGPHNMKCLSSILPNGVIEYIYVSIGFI